MSADPITRLRRERQARHLHRLGPRPVLEALIDAAKIGDVDEVLERYAKLEPGTVRAVGADDFPPAPIREIGR